MSDLARKRKLQNNPPKGKRKSRGAVASEPSSISPLTQLKEYP